MSWLRRRRVARLRAAPFPEAWRALLARHLPRWSRLDDAARRRLEGDVAVFLAEKEIVGCAGFVVDDAVRLAIAGEACTLLLGMPDDVDVFPRVHEVLVYPSPWRATQGEALGGGLRLEGDVVRSGEAWHDGQVILAWDEVRRGLRHPDDGRDVVLHEFAHALDHEAGPGDGAPRLPSPARYAAWARVLGAAYAGLRRDVEQGRADVLRPYGATAPAEFFAVATETFFERPHALRAEHPELYEQLAAFYGQDPAAEAAG
jgi:Mlc titration factor MtfA (ptsG expression regulator)